jgi:hypothetical protein
MEFGDINLVSGVKKPMFCEIARTYDKYCGQDGTHYVDAREVDLDMQHQDMANQQRNDDQGNEPF